MAETYVPTDFDDPAQAGPAYPVYPRQIDKNFAVHHGVAGAFAVHEAAVPGMTVVVDTGRLQAGIALVEQAQQTTGVITAPVTDPRNDIVVVDSATAAFSVLTGVEAASPVDPAIPAGKIPLARVRLLTSTTVITNTIIDDLRPLIRGASSNKQGANLAVAAALPLLDDGDWNFVVSGSGGSISSFDSVSVGAIKTLVFDVDAELLDGQDLVLPGGADMFVEVGAAMQFVEYVVGRWKCISYLPGGVSKGKLAFKDSAQPYLSTTLAGDPELADFFLAASGRYKVEGYLPVVSGNASPNFKFSFSDLSGGDGGYISVRAITGTSQAVYQGEVDDVFTFNLSQNIYTGIHITGVVNVGLSARNVTLQAGTVSSSIIANLLEGAYLKFKKMRQG
jgi:hypothetical protein